MLPDESSRLDMVDDRSILLRFRATGEQVGDKNDESTISFWIEGGSDSRGWLSDGSCEGDSQEPTTLDGEGRSDPEADSS